MMNKCSYDGYFFCNRRAKWSFEKCRLYEIVPYYTTDRTLGNNAVVFYNLCIKYITLLTSFFPKI